MTPPKIHALTIDDLDDCLAIAVDRDWRPEAHKWRLLFELGTVYGTRDEHDSLVGTTAVTRFEGVAAIGMVLVAKSHAGRGLGRALMEHAIAADADAVFILNATEFGQPLYSKLGFVTVGMTHTHVGVFGAAVESAATDTVTRVVGVGEVPSLVELDAAVVGARRASLIERLFGYADEIRVVERDGETTGFAARWSNIDNTQIGPIVAESEDDAKALINDLAAGAGGPVRLDLDGRHPRLRAWASEHGVAPLHSSTLMVKNAASFPGDRSRWFSPLMQAVG
ncbi:GNAT family N-acetyltransferase [Luethyella okanaganae]|uniref:GNAT family N-acetyltransferase n=1 Tax=Luethyella okanaganae TaxID=69372 RepID=A0ABW1VDN7_9MICO